MDAYYYSFKPTGNGAIDKILSAVACAGKACHHTEDWYAECGTYAGHTGSCQIDWIQNAASEAAESFNALRQEVEAKDAEIASLRREVERLRAAVRVFVTSRGYVEDGTYHLVARGNPDIEFLLGTEKEAVRRALEESL